MTDAADTPDLPETPDGPDLGAIRDEIDELADQPTEDLVSPKPAALARDEPDPQPTEPVGSVDWEDPEKAPEPTEPEPTD